MAGAQFLDSRIEDLLPFRRAAAARSAEFVHFFYRQPLAAVDASALGEVGKVRR